MIFIFVGVLISAYSFLSYKKAMALYLAFRLFWHSGIVVMQDGKMPTITLSLLMNSIFLVSYFFRKRDLPSLKVSFPYTIPFSCIAISYFVTCFTSVSGFIGELTRSISMILENILFIWLLWRTFETNKDLRRIVKILVISFCFMAIYGLFEYAIKSNPFIDYKGKLITGGITLYSSTNEALRRGYRLISVMEHPIGTGMTMGLFIVFILSVMIIYKEKDFLNYRILAILTVGMCVLCVFLTKMRSSILFLLIGLIPLIDLKSKTFYKFFFGGTVLLICFFPLLSDNIDVLLSLFSKRAQTNVGGSSWTQRMSQFNAVWNLLKMSPIGGLGEKFESIISNEYTRAALGYESVWFIQMSRHGVVGIIANIILAVYSIIIIPNKYNSKFAFFLSLSYWIVYTITSIPSFRTELYYLLLFYYIKRSQIYKQEKLRLRKQKKGVYQS